MISTRKFNLINDWYVLGIIFSAPCQDWENCRECLPSTESKNLLGSLCPLAIDKLGSSCSPWFVESPAPHKVCCEFLGTIDSHCHLRLYSPSVSEFIQFLFRPCQLRLTPWFFYMKTRIWWFMEIFWDVMWSIAFIVCWKGRNVKLKGKQPRN